MPSQLRNNIVALLDRQIEKGVNTYGHYLDDAPTKPTCNTCNQPIQSAEGFDWKMMALEELIDLVQYQQKLIQELQNQPYLMTVDTRAPYMDLDD